MKRERSDAPKEKGDLSFSRREFLQAAGGGIVIFFTCGNLAAQERRPRGFQELPTDFNAYLRIKDDGRVTMGLGYSLTEEVHFKGGQIFDRNFDTYQIPRFSSVPRIDTVLLENLEVPAQGGGEPPIVCVGGSIANAIFDATGARLFDLPMTAERVKKALVGK